MDAQKLWETPTGWVTGCARVTGLLVTSMLSIGAVTTANASPWTLPEGAMSVSMAMDLQTATEEFVEVGGDQRLQAFPLDGAYFAANLRPSLRYGINNRMEIGGSLSLSHLSYEADEIYLGDLITTEVGEDGSYERFRANLLSLDREQFGLGDLRLYLRNRLMTAQRAVVTTEIGVKLPTGYDPPGGTFRNDNPADGTQDDVALGDGQADIDFVALFGFVPVNDWFIRIDAGFRARLFGPGQQIIGNFKTGYRINEYLLPYVYVDAQHSVTEGESVGLSFRAIDPSQPAALFQGDNLSPEEVRLDRTAIQPGGGVLFSLGDRSLDIGYAQVVYGRNIGRLHIVSFTSTFVL